MTDVQQQKPEQSLTKRPAPWGKAVGTVLTCLALGPPIGAVVFTFSLTIYMWATGKPAGGDSGFWASFLGSFFVLLFAVPFSYILGGVQALLTGLVFAAHGWWRGSVPWWLAVAAGVVMFGGMAVAGGVEDADAFPLFLATHLAASVGCWLIVRNFWRLA